MDCLVSKHSRDDDCGADDAFPGEKDPKLFDRAPHADFRGIFTDAEGLANFPHRLPLEESQQDRQTILFTELIHRLIQDRGQLFPSQVGISVLKFHLCRLSFAVPPPAFRPQSTGGCKARRSI